MNSLHLKVLVPSDTARICLPGFFVRCLLMLLPRRHLPQEKCLSGQLLPLSQ